MIVECAHCRTRFHLDDTRVPAAGVQVRCSRCKHAFFLKPPSETRTDEPTQVRPAEPPAEAPVAAEPSAAPEPPPAASARAPEPPAPEPEAEFFDFGGGANPDHDASEEESDWEFNTDFPEEEDVATPGLGPQARTPAAAEESLSLDDVGSPEEWNLIGEDAEDPLEVAGEPAAPARSPAAPRPAPTRAPASREPVQAPSALPPRRATGGPPLLGWSLTALLLLLVAHGGLRVSAQRADSAREGTPVAGLVAEELRGRRVENAWGPTLYVVSGRLRNPDVAVRPPGALVTVRLARANGTPIPGLRAPAGGALASDVLREAPPEQIRTWQQRSARRIAGVPIAPGESIRFDAVFEELPAEAALVELEWSAWTETEPPAPAEPAQAEAPEGAATTTSSSPPSAPPSSE